MAVVSGSVERITYYNVENGYAVFRVKSALSRDLDTVVGTTSPLVAGQLVEAEGEWIEDKKFGLQLKATRIVVQNPISKKGILKFLSSGFLPGIGEAYAKKIVDAFAENSLDVIRDEPAKLKSIAGLGTKKAMRASRALREQGALAELMVFLQGHGLGVSMAQRLISLYGADVIEVVKNNPYRLVDEVDGIGFHSADELALKLGLDKNSQERFFAAVQYVLKKASTEGHLFLPRELLMAELQKILDVEIAWSDELPVVVENDRVYSKYHHRLEVDVSEYIKKFIHADFTQLKTDLISHLEEKEGLTLSEAQRAALEQSLTSKLSIITGGPGTGKSTITQFLVKAARAQGKRVALAAPTGRAAQRLEEICSTEASTLHRLLKYDPSVGSFHYNKDTPLEVDLLLVDESSMLDLVMARNLLSALPEKSQLVLVGDRDQLPPVGVGSFFSDMIDSKAVSVSVLDKIYRQGKGSGIVEAAHRLNTGQNVAESSLGDDFYFIEENDPKTLQEKIIEVVSNRIPKKFGFDASEIQVLSPMYRGVLGIDQINLSLQSALNPDPSKSFQKAGVRWGVGDRVVVLKNNYEKEVFNGDLGYIKGLDLEEEELLVAFDRGHTVSFSFDEARDLQLAYCISIHKSQGSEFPAVVVPLSTQHFRMLRRKLLYTALTRGKKLCVLIGSRRAFQIALKNFQEQLRYSALIERILS
ncbi:MAG: ATP-dependent RecD-like DNA helicase [Bdellovibrionota bacterium]